MRSRIGAPSSAPPQWADDDATSFFSAHREESVSSRTADASWPQPPSHSPIHGPPGDDIAHSSLQHSTSSTTRYHIDEAVVHLWHLPVDPERLLQRSTMPDPTVTSSSALVTVATDRAVLYCYERVVPIETLLPRHIAAVAVSLDGSYVIVSSTSNVLDEGAGYAMNDQGAIDAAWDGAGKGSRLPGHWCQWTAAVIIPSTKDAVVSLKLGLAALRVQSTSEMVMKREAGNHFRAAAGAGLSKSVVTTEIEQALVLQHEARQLIAMLSPTVKTGDAARSPRLAEDRAAVVKSLYRRSRTSSSKRKHKSRRNRRDSSSSSASASSQSSASSSSDAPQHRRKIQLRNSGHNRNFGALSKAASATMRAAAAAAPAPPVSTGMNRSDEFQFGYAPMTMAPSRSFVLDEMALMGPDADHRQAATACPLCARVDIQTPLFDPAQLRAHIRDEHGAGESPYRNLSQNVLNPTARSYVIPSNTALDATPEEGTVDYFSRTTLPAASNDVASAQRLRITSAALSSSTAAELYGEANVIPGVRAPSAAILRAKEIAAQARLRRLGTSTQAGPHEMRPAAVPLALELSHEMPSMMNKVQASPMDRESKAAYQPLVSHSSPMTSPHDSLRGGLPHDFATLYGSHTRPQELDRMSSATSVGPVESVKSSARDKSGWETCPWCKKPAPLEHPQKCSRRPMKCKRCGVKMRAKDHKTHDCPAKHSAEL